MAGTIRVALDIGGTFTDVAVAAGDHIVRTRKVLTTYEDPLIAVAQGIREGLQSTPIDASDPQLLLHATTLVSNALISRGGRPVSLLVTRGFGDTILIGDEGRYDMYDLEIEYPPPLVSDLDVIEVSERTDHTGAVLEPIDRHEIERIAPLLNSSVAVVLLHSYANPANERAIREALAVSRPELAVSLSSDVAREVGEYPRMSTTVANAYVQPLVAPYISRLEQLARDALGSRARVLMMLSSGGLTPVTTAAAIPIRIVESGPAAGVAAAQAFIDMSPRTLGHGGCAVTLDMGGTTAKIAFLEAGRAPTLRSSIEVARHYRLKRGSGIPLLVPSVDLIEIGAGGGSIARRNEVGLMQVGPESAGSEPGPAAYGRGGTDATVTDANIVLGYIPPWQRLGGIEALDGALAREAVARVGREIGMDIASTALAIHDVANEHMAAALRVAAAERGLKLDQYALVAFGGAAPLHACGVAERAGLRRVVIPPEPGVFSATGLALATIAYEAVRPLRVELPMKDRRGGEVASCFVDMAIEIENAVGSEVEHVASADLRFRGQHAVVETEVRLVDGEVCEQELQEAFAQRYVRTFGRLPKAQVEAVAWRLRGIGPKPSISLDISHMSPPGRLPEQSHRAIFRSIDGRGTSFDADVLHRAALGAAGRGPTLIVEDHTTTVVPPNWRWERFERGSVVLVADTAG